MTDDMHKFAPEIALWCCFTIDSGPKMERTKMMFCSEEMKTYLGLDQQKIEHIFEVCLRVFVETKIKKRPKWDKFNYSL